ncbi:DnaJ domain-containing protein [Haloarcula sp. Atlit-7R]|uniref:J domain-containing protein n=1 Tax=Haloarcula sp. Atlit-7R TaxID=2282125 RepID=UPI000EF14792|nr:hypothetical protein D3D01_16185 [Haloarcula sp. Atlit-7R]
MDISTAQEILGVKDEATDEDIEEAFREKIKEVHPDQNNSHNADEHSKRVIKARKLLLSSSATTESNSARTGQRQSHQEDRTSASPYGDASNRGQDHTKGSSANTSGNSTYSDSVQGDSSTQNQSQSRNRSTDAGGRNASTDTAWGSDSQSGSDQSSQQSATESAENSYNNSQSHTRSNSTARSSAQSATNRSTATVGGSKSNRSQSKQSHKPQQSAGILQLLLGGLSSLPDGKLGGMVFSVINVGSIGVIALSALYSNMLFLSELWFRLSAFGLWILSSGFVGVSLDIREGWSEGLMFLMYPFAAAWIVADPDVGPQFGGAGGTLLLIVVLLFPAIIGFGAVGWHVLRHAVEEYRTV